MSISRLLIANRGEIAVRIIQTCRKLGIETIALYTPAEAGCLAAIQADMAIALPAGTLAQNYLNPALLISLAKEHGAEAIHPGYGFLSENPDFADACEKANITFIGPSADIIRTMALKHEAKAFMASAGVPVLPGYNGTDQSDAALQSAAESVGYPLLIKAAAGGGGRGMRVVHESKELNSALARAKQESLTYFNDDHLLLERFFEKARHIEVQIVGDKHGTVLHFGTRECSLQRRHQKVIEEAPALLPQSLIDEMCTVSVNACRKLGYVGAGTLEFLVTPSNAYFFLEMNTRLQVEHPVSEQVCGQDLVALQLCAAAGDPLSLKQNDIQIQGHSIEARVYAEDPSSGFLPSTGRITALHFFEDEQVRIDSGVSAGDSISPHFDPMLAKIIVTAENRNNALSLLSHSIENSYIVGVKHNLNFLNQLVLDPNVITNDISTQYIDNNTDVLTTPPEIDHEWCSIFLHTWLERVMDTELNAWQLNRPPLLRTCWQIDEQLMDISFALQDGHYQCRWDSHFLEGQLDNTFATWQEKLSDRCLLSYKGWCREIRFKDAIERSVNNACAGSLNAPMPGKVSTLLVAPEQLVAQGDKLLILEAMKMEHTITAPRAGKVTALLVKEAQQVTAGQPLLALEESSDD